MTREVPRLIAAGVLALMTGASALAQATIPAAAPQTAQAAATANQPNAADVHFMTGMIPHHAQAVLIAGWAPTRAQRADLKILCERIVVGQRDEIELMQVWLRDRGLPVPDAKATHMKMTMNGMEHDMLMPGMLTDDQLKALEAARGTEFDRLFLIAMIKHHEGALTMVEELFKAYGEEPDMPDKLKEYVRQSIDELLQSLPAEDRLKGLSLEDRLKGFSPQEVAKALSPEVLEALARQQKPNGSANPPT
jgi:uncharacterized protein (DUF305 family)